MNPDRSNLTLPLERVLAAVHGAQPTTRGYEAQCPAHEDRVASLTISVADDGKVLLKCHAGDGCPFDRIVAGLGLEPRDLFPDNGPRRTTAPRIVATYDYCDPDANDALLLQVVRREPKSFRQRQPNGHGGWIPHVQGVKRVLYRASALRATPPNVPPLIAEGEKDVDRLAGDGYVATTCLGGAEKWLPSYTAEFAGVPVVVIADNDAPGHAHAQQVAAAVHPLATWVKVIDLPDVPEHGDYS